MKDSNVSIDDVLDKCQETLHKFSKKKKGRVGILFSRIGLSVRLVSPYPYLCYESYLVGTKFTLNFCELVCLAFSPSLPLLWK